MPLPTNDNQFGFGKIQRRGTSPITIAHLPGISRQVVSRTLMVMEGTIESALRGLAQSNHIVIEKISNEQGILLGRSGYLLMFGTKTISYTTVGQP